MDLLGQRLRTLLLFEGLQLYGRAVLIRAAYVYVSAGSGKVEAYAGYGC